MPFDPESVRGYSKKVKDHARGIYEKLPIGPNFERFYDSLKYAGFFASLFLFVMVFVIGVMFLAGPYSPYLFMTNTFLVQYDNDNNITWPILTTNTWSGLARTVSPYTDIKTEHKYECLFQAKAAPLCNSYDNIADWYTCLKASYSSALTACATTNSYNYKTLWPTTAQYQSCVSNYFAFGRQQYNAFDSCLKTDMWPLFEYPQDIDSTYLLGSYNWMLLLLTGSIIYAMFAFWTSSYKDGSKEHAVIRYGKPAGGWFTRMNTPWVVVGTAGLVLWSILLAVIVYRGSGTVPSTTSAAYYTNTGAGLLVLFASSVALVYFVLELVEFYDGKDRDDSRRKVHPSSESRLGEYTTNPSRPFREITSKEQTAEEYAPILMVAWSDAYLADALIFTGVMGATLQVFTSDVWSVFTWILLYRLLQSAAARLIYEAYVKNDAEVLENHCKISKTGPEAIGGAYAAQFSLKISALAFHLAGTLCAFELFMIIFNPNRALWDYTFFFWITILGLLVPEFIRTVFNLYIAMRDGDHSIPVLVVYQFIWAWDVLIRVIMLFVVFWGTVDMPGTYNFLSDQYTSMSTTLAFSGINLL